MTTKACDAWKALRGIICSYKPSESSWKYSVIKLRNNICRDLNNLETRPPKNCLKIDRSGSELTVSVKPSYADNILCSGPRYPAHSVCISVPTPLSELASGVSIATVNDGGILSEVIKKLNFTKCYHLKGILGQATANCHINERVVCKAKYSHVKKSNLDKYINFYVSASHRRIFEEYGVPLNSQEAYNFALKGLYRPVFKGAPIIYSLDIVEFEPPNFTLEVQCIFETDSLFLSLIHNLGVSVKSYATCTGIRCIRHGCFHVKHALARNQWNLDNVLENIKLCWELFEAQYPEKVKHSFTIKAKKPSSDTKLISASSPQALITAS